MDNQNSKKSFFDKVSSLVNKEGQPQQPVAPTQLENVRTQSMVVSDREQAEKDLQAMMAEREQAQHAQTVEAVTANAKKTGVYIIIVAICVILLILVSILIFTLIPYLRRPTNPEIHTGGGEVEEVTIGFYKCMTNDCKEMTELPDGRVLIKDGNYVILDKENEQSFTTTISGHYESATAFEWGEKLYVHVKLETGVGQIFSITDNKSITSDSYEEVYADIEDDKYAGQQWIKGQYIIAKRMGDYRMIDITTGREKVQGTKGVYATKNGYFVAYDESGSRRIFNGSNIQLAFVEGGEIYTRDEYILAVYNDNNVAVYDKDGNEVQEYSFKSEIERMEWDKRSESIANDSNYTKVPN